MILRRERDGVKDKKKIKLLGLYSAGHFLVDLASAFLMLTLISDFKAENLYCLLIYNFCAFALQMPFGLIADKLDRNAAVAVTGFGFALAAFFLYPVPLACSAVLGIGNALYHVGGGVDVLHFSDTKQWMLGVYVSPGALGLFVGGLLAKNKLMPLSYGFVFILMAALIITFLLDRTYRLVKPSGNVTSTVKPTGRAPIIAFVALFLVVVLRSYVGMTLSFEWKTGVWAIFAVLGLVFGKTAGGFLADRFGAVRASVLSLAICSVLFLFSDIAICGLLSIFLFNMTMPLTLFAMVRLFRGARGFAFGTLTFALFLGYLPTNLSLPVPFEGEGWFYAVETLISLVLLTVGILAAREVRTDE